MKRYNRWVRLAMLVCAAITIVSALPSSLAYMTARSNQLHNAFRVVYLPPQDISVPVVIQKSMVNLTNEKIGPGGFAFRLINQDTGEAVTATSAENGLAAMHLTFTAADVGKTYRYRLYELNTGRENVTYDDAVYDISITLVLNELHEMTAQLTVNGQAVTEIIAVYQNEYAVPAAPPHTGDQAPLLLWMALLAVSGTGLALLHKNRTVFRRL